MSRGRRLIAIGALMVAALGCAPGGSGSPVPTDQVDLPKSYRFAPEAIVVPVGTTVTWTNSDNFTHSVQFEGDTTPGMVVKPGETVTRRFETVGTFPYVCAFHPQDMQGTLVVSGD